MLDFTITIACTSMSKHQPVSSEYFSNCLFFTISKLSREIARLADESFSPTGLSPTYAFLMMLVNEQPGIAQKELSGHLHLAQSTVTRFIDKLEHRGLVTRSQEGKNSFITATAEGKAIMKSITAAWTRLYHRYSKLLGYSEAERLTILTRETAHTLSVNAKQISS
jgi:MarR family transcriptional regulator, organic hydroperoxide resistance regulator